MSEGRWWTCDGGGRPAQSVEPQTSPEPPAGEVSRRAVLLGAAAGLLGWLGTRSSALAQVAIHPEGRREGRNVLVALFLRGGADGLSMVVPYGEDAYYRLRPSLGVAAPGDRRSSERLEDLDGFFGLHPSLAPIVPLYREGKMALVQAVGSWDQTRSHFEAMSAMERGLPKAGPGAAGGWLARYLSLGGGAGRSPLRAVAFGGTMPDSLSGAPAAIALDSLADFRLAVGDRRADDRWRSALAEIYSVGGDEVAAAGRETLAVLETIRRLDPSRYAAEHGAQYPQSDLGQGLKQVAFLVKSDVGLEVACLDKGGFDTHVAQGSTSGWLPSLLEDLSSSLAAFALDLGSELSRVTVAVQTEFGRRARENTQLGTDHGRASVMMLIGGGIRGGKVYGDWPGLEESQLEPPGDLRVTTDYRHALGEVLMARFGVDDPSAVFPGVRPGRVGAVA